MIDVLIVEDDPQYAAALRDQLDADCRFGRIDVVASLGDARELLSRTNPQLVVLDLGLPDGSGIELLEGLDASVAAVVLTVFGDETHVLEALSHGAAGYLLKDDTEIPDRLAVVADGASPMSARAARYLLESWRLIAGTVDTQSPLSPRESETLEWLAQGCSYQEAAERMTISTHTVSDHVKRIYRKLAVNSRAAAVHEALRLGYIHSPHRPNS